jgi:peptidyl-dipeptidase Dcp
MKQKKITQSNFHFLSLFLVCGLLSVGMISSASVKDSTKNNPFFQKYNTPFNVPPFDKIMVKHYLPAIKEGIKKQQTEIEVITSNPEPPTFHNTIEALNDSGMALREVENVFYNLLDANTNDRMQTVAKRIAPILSKHDDDIRLNEKLFKRVKMVYQKKGKLALTGEQNRLLDEYYRNFVRGGANLDLQKQAKLRELNKELSLLTLKFGENVLKENNHFTLVIEKKEELAGLPQSVITAAAEAAKETGNQGKWVFTLHKPSMIPFLQYSQKRKLREKIFKAYINRGNHNNERDNKDTLARIASLRLQKARLLGYETHAHYILEKNMAKKPANVYKLINQLWKAALPVAKKEARELQDIINQEGGKFKLQPWDWWFYAEKFKKKKYDLDDRILRPYFKLENVRDGAFAVAKKLFGIKFVKRPNIPKPHKDAQVFEVQEKDGSHIGILYMDFFPRASKRGGAWMNAYRKQHIRNGKKIPPVITNVCNFPRPSGDKPSLLSVGHVATLFHEFGHALHGLLSNCQYIELSGTAVPWDFVELPSQIMENWASESEVLNMFARHYKTGEVIPRSLIKKIKKSGHFNQGFATVEYLSACFLDMDWHTVTEAKKFNVDEFESRSMEKIGLIPEIVVRYRSTYFRHIFSGGYSAGYYSYIWSGVLDADAFEAFKETSLFDQKTALSLRKNIYEKGGTEDPMVLYKRFRGAEPRIEPLLKRRGLLK